MSDILRDEAAARINALTGVTPDDPRRRAVRSIRNAAETASHCAGCGRTLKPDKPVWRQRVWLGHSPFGGSHYSVAPFCATCSGKRNWRKEHHEQCEGCGRPVFNERLWGRRHTFCSEVCKGKAASAAARRRRTEARGSHQCQDCGETFKPTRTGARFCSVACKQRAYRKRVTDDKRGPGFGRKSRNGGAP